MIYKIRFFDAVCWTWRTELVVASNFEEAIAFLCPDNGCYPQKYSHISQEIFILEQQWNLQPGILDLGCTYGR